MFTMEGQFLSATVSDRIIKQSPVLSKRPNARPSADWQGQQNHFTALKSSQAQPFPIIVLLANSAVWALLGGPLAYEIT